MEDVAAKIRCCCGCIGTICFSGGAGDNLEIPSSRMLPALVWNRILRDPSLGGLDSGEVSCGEGQGDDSSEFLDDVLYLGMACCGT